MPMMPVLTAEIGKTSRNWNNAAVLRISLKKNTKETGGDMCASARSVLLKPVMRGAYRLSL